MVNPHKAWQAKHYKSLLLACPFHFLGYLGWFYWTSSVSPKSARRFETQDNDSTFLFKHPSKKGVSKHHGNTKIPLQTNGSKTEAKFDMQSYLEEQLRNSSHWPEVQIPSWVFSYMYHLEEGLETTDIMCHARVQVWHSGFSHQFLRFHSVHNQKNEKKSEMTRRDMSQKTPSEWHFLKTPWKNLWEKSLDISEPGCFIANWLGCGVACHNHGTHGTYLKVPQSQILRWKVGNGTTGGIATQKFEIKIYRWNAFQKYQVICMNYLFVHLDHIWIGSNIGSKAIHKSRLPMVGFENKLASLKSPCLSWFLKSAPLW